MRNEKDEHFQRVYRIQAIDIDEEKGRAALFLALDHLLFLTPEVAVLFDENHEEIQRYEFADTDEEFPSEVALPSMEPEDVISPISPSTVPEGDIFPISPSAAPEDVTSPSASPDLSLSEIGARSLGEDMISFPDADIAALAALARKSRRLDTEEFPPRGVRSAYDILGLSVRRTSTAAYGIGGAALDAGNTLVSGVRGRIRRFRPAASTREAPAAASAGRRFGLLQWRRVTPSIVVNAEANCSSCG